MELFVLGLGLGLVLLCLLMGPGPRTNLTQNWIFFFFLFSVCCLVRAPPLPALRNKDVTKADLML